MEIVKRIPLLKLFFYKTTKNIFEKSNQSFALMKDKYIQHIQTYQSGEIRDFCDALIYANQEETNNEKGSADYFNDKNITLLILDLFFGRFAIFNL